MLKSMTAFSRVQDSCEKGSVVWEIRSVNHRYLEIGVRLPDDFKSIEPDLRKKANRFLARGKVDFTLRFTMNGVQANEISLNNEVIAGLVKAEQQILSGGERARLSIGEILKWTGVVMDEDVNIAPLLALAMKTLDDGLKQLVDMRVVEGKALADLLLNRCDQIEKIVRQLRVHRPQMMSALEQKWRNNLADKIQQWADGTSDGRLEQELVMLAQKLDIDEELDRLDTHMLEIRKILKRSEAVGRRLDFLMQELNREANTLASKSNDSITTQYSVDLKVLIEQMREQIQNIE